MAHSLGVASEKLPDGNWVGTTPESLQRIIGQLYMNDGIVPGDRGATTRVRGTTGWSYSVPALVAFIWTNKSARRGVLTPMEAATVTVSAPVAGASRTDTIYVTSEGVFRVAQGTGAPAGSVVVDRMVIPAGATNTQGAVSNWDTVYAIPAGASLGNLAHYDFPAATWAGPIGQDVTRFTKRFVVPTDRLVRAELSVSTESVSTATGWSAIGVEIDGTWRRALHATYGDDEETQAGLWTAELTAGVHEVTVFTVKFRGADFKTAPLASASEMNIWDAGPTI